MSERISDLQCFRYPQLRLDTLIRVRWVAILGQTTAILSVTLLLDFEFNWIACAGLILVSAILNILLLWRYKSNLLLKKNTTMYFLFYDTFQMALLLYLTGGLQNPFSVLLSVPAIISSTIQTARHTIFLVIVCVISATFLAFEHQPLPWYANETLQFPLLYIIGVWTAIISSLCFTTIYAFQVAHQGRKLANALQASELVLQREQHISALDGLSAAAAHELGTPLATIALVSKELIRDLPKNSPFIEDIQLLNSQSERCRNILCKITSLPEKSKYHTASIPLFSLMNEIADTQRDLGIKLIITHNGEGKEPILKRNPAIIYGISNLLENAVDFSQNIVHFSAKWNSDFLEFKILDDGPGFSPELFKKIGDPFITDTHLQYNWQKNKCSRRGGLGLGLFIAKTLLERTQASLIISNRNDGHSGASVIVRWKSETIILTPDNTLYNIR